MNVFILPATTPPPPIHTPHTGLSLGRQCSWDQGLLPEHPTPNKVTLGVQGSFFFLPGGPVGSKETQPIPGAPIPGLHLPGDTSQAHSSLRPFWTAPFSPATVGGGPGPLQTRAADGGVGLPLESLSPHFSVPLSLLQEPVLTSQSPQCLPAALEALVVTRDSLY